MTLPSSHTYRSQRVWFQAATLLLLVLIPALGGFRIDLAHGSLLLLGADVTLRNFPAMAGLAIILATGPLVLVTMVGTYWCGWACPQNTLGEWANRRTRELLGARATVEVANGVRAQVAPSKNRLVNWLRLAAGFLAVSLVMGLLPLFYFFPPSEVLALVTNSESVQFSRFMERLYLVSVTLAFINIAWIRYFLCNYACLFRFGTLLFRRQPATDLHYDQTRSADCERCNFCTVSCPTQLKPIALKPFDRCIQCGECVDACHQLHDKRSDPARGLLRLDTGAGARIGSPGAIAARIGWHGLAFIAGCLLMGYGLLNP